MSIESLNACVIARIAHVFGAATVGATPFAAQPVEARAAALQACDDWFGVRFQAAEGAEFATVGDLVQAIARRWREEPWTPAMIRASLPI